MPAIAAASPSSGRALISGGNDSTIRMWELDDFLAERTAARNVDTLEAVLTLDTPNGPLAVFTTADNGLELWDLYAGSPTGRRFTGATAAVQAMTTGRLADDTPVLVAGTWDATVLIWDLDTGALVLPPLKGHRSPVHSVELVSLPDGAVALVTGGWDAVRTWDPTSGRQGPPLVQGQQSALATVHLPESGPQAVVGRPDGRVTVWDVASGELSGIRVEPANAAITCLKVAEIPGGQTVAAVGDAASGIRVIDVRTGAMAAPRIEVHPGGILAMTVVALSAQQTALITADAEPAVRCWDINSADPIGAPLPVPYPVRAMAVQSEERPLLVLGGNGVSAVRFLHGMG